MPHWTKNTLRRIRVFFKLQSFRNKYNIQTKSRFNLVHLGSWWAFYNSLTAINVANQLQSSFSESWLYSFIEESLLKWCDMKYVSFQWNHVIGIQKHKNYWIRQKSATPGILLLKEEFSKQHQHSLKQRWQR